MKYVSLSTIFLLTCISISCNDKELKPVDGVIVALSGYANGTYELEVFNDYEVSQSPRDYTSLLLSIKKNGTPNFELALTLSEDGNGTGFQEKREYIYTDGKVNNIGFYSWLYVGESYFYLPASTEKSKTNKIEFTRIDDKNIAGSFEVNLTTAPNAGDHKIRIVGNFDINR